MVLVRSSRDRIAMADEGRVCSVAWQRQHVHHQQYSTRAGIKLAAQAGEALPVVELRPFTKRVWRREKSLPNFSERPILKDDSGADSSRNSSIPPPPYINQYVRDMREQRKAVDPRHSMDRHRHKLHPKADFSFDGSTLAEHKQDLIPTFVSRQERSKTTLGEDGGGTAVAVPSGSAAVGVSSNVDEDTMDRPTGQEAVVMLARDSSNLMATYTRDKPLQHQNVCLMGDKMPMTNLGRRNLTYLNPFSLYRHKQAWNEMRLENSPNGLSPPQKVTVSFLARDGGALASPSINHLPSQDLVFSGSLLYNPDRTMQQPFKVRQTSPHKFHQKLGAAQDAFVVLSKAGAPTVVEQSLSFDQEVRLERCRRERSFAAVSEMNTFSPTQYLSYDSQPTLGETSLMKAREANASRDRRRVVHRKNGFDKSITTLPSFTQNNSSVQRRVLVDSLKSNKCGQGDPDMKSAEGHRDDTTKLAESTGTLPQNLMTPAFPQLPRDSGARENNVRELHTEFVQVCAPADSAALLEGDLESLVESTDEYQRPLSDTAATETVHVRNEQTPMSADNRARLLPRYDANLDVIKTGREYTPQRSNIESAMGGTGPSRDAVVKNETQVATEKESGIETMNTDANKSRSKGPNPAVLPSLHANGGQAKNESLDNEDNVKRADSAGSPTKVSRRNSKSDSITASVELTSDQIGSNGQQSDLLRVNTNSPVPRQTSGHWPGSAHKPQLQSVNSSVSSFENMDIAQDPDEQYLAASGSFTRENLTEEGKESSPCLDDSQKMRSTRRLSTNNSATSNTMSDSSSSELDKSNTVLDAPSKLADGFNAKSDISNKALDGPRAVSSAPSKILYTSNAMSDISSAVLDGSSTMLDASSTVLDESSTILDGSSTVFDTSSTVLDTRNNREEKPSERRSAAVNDSEQEELLSGSLNAKSVSEDEAAAFFSSMDQIKITHTRQTKADEHPNSPVAQNVDANATKTEILKPDQTTSKSIPQDKNLKESIPSAEKAKREENNEATSSTNNTVPSSESKANQNADEAIHGDHTPNSLMKPNSSVNDTARKHQHRDNDVQNGVETMVTVTMETADCEDSFDASKVFLTTANVDSEDWQNIVTL